MANSCNAKPQASPVARHSPSRAIEPDARTLASFGFLPEPHGECLVYTPSQVQPRFQDGLGEVRCMLLAGNKAHFQSCPAAQHSNSAGTVHGGYLMSLIDIVIFVGPAVLGVERALGGQTIEVSTKFLGPVQPGSQIDLFVDVVRETGRMVFSHGMIEQAGQAVVLFSAITRKASA